MLSVHPIMGDQEKSTLPPVFDHRLRDRAQAHPGLQPADDRQGAARHHRGTDRLARTHEQARAGGQVATAGRAHQPTAAHQAAVRHAGHRLGARASSALIQPPAPQTTRLATCVAGLVRYGRSGKSTLTRVFRSGKSTLTPVFELGLFEPALCVATHRPLMW